MSIPLALLSYVIFPLLLMNMGYHIGFRHAVRKAQSLPYGHSGTDSCQDDNDE